MTIDTDITRTTYLGDGLYASFDGYQIKLFSSDGNVVTNEVYLDPSTIKAFEAYIKSLRVNSVIG